MQNNRKPEFAFKRNARRLEKIDRTEIFLLIFAPEFEVAA